MAAAAPRPRGAAAGLLAPPPAWRAAAAGPARPRAEPPPAGAGAAPRGGLPAAALGAAAGAALEGVSRRRRGQRAARRPGASVGPKQRWPRRGARSSTATRAVGDDAADLEFEVTPWAGDAEALPIFACSDAKGLGVTRLVSSTWKQFGNPEASNVMVRPEVRSPADVEQVVAEAAGPSSEADGETGALVVYTLKSQELSSQMASECQRRGVPCVDVAQPLMAALSESVGQAEASSIEVFVASDSSGRTPTAMVVSALQRLPGGSSPDEVTVCPETRTVEEVKQVVEAAAKSGGRSVVAFTFASSGLARFMRQQCEEAGVRFVDVFQPVLLAFETYLRYPAIGVPGGYTDTKAPSKWKKVAVERAA